jgi:hypothetical protein
MSDRTADDLRDQLTEVERNLANVLRTAQEIRAGVGDAEDPSDRGALIQAADEQDSLADQLIARRDDLRRKLGEA